MKRFAALATRWPRGLICGVRLLIAVAIACCVCVTGPVSAYAFTDVSSSTPHAGDINWLGTTGISQGYSDGSYGCMKPVYRQDMAAFLRRLAVQMGDTEAQSWQPSSEDWSAFTDINSNTPHAEDILWLAKTGVSTGYPNGNGSYSFRPMTPVYRQDMAAFMRRLASHLGDSSTAAYTDYGQNPGYFSDVNADVAHYRDIWWLRDFGITEGYSDGTYRGMTFVYRQDMAAFIRRFYNEIDHKGSSDKGDDTPEPGETPDYSADLYVLGSGDGVPVYSDRVVIIFAKTDGHISGYTDYQVFDASGQREHADMIGMSYADIEGVGNYVVGGWREVNGGYVCLTEFASSGQKTFNFRVDQKVVASIKINVVDGERAASEWMDRVLDSVTTSSMDPFQKMEAVSKYLRSKFRYSTTFNNRYVYLARYQVPYWISYRWNSYISPAVLCEFAEKIGGFDDVHNCYDDYEYGSTDWQNTHYLCKVTRNGVTKSYWACPDSATGAIESYSKIDFTDLNQVLHFDPDALRGLSLQAELSSGADT